MNKKISVLGGKITLLIILIAMIGIGLRYFASVAMAKLDPNYGTTTFFSEKNEIPSANPPIYDVGVNAINNNSNNDSKKNEKSNDNNDGDDDDGLFDNVITSINNFFGGSVEQTNSTDESLFNWQQDSNVFGDSSDVTGDDEFIMGARGESLENIDDEEATKYNNRIADGFNFREGNASSAPKKSKLLFTNIIVSVDLTTQYILIGFIFSVAIGLAIGYYFWKKETAETTTNPNEDY